MIPTNPLRQKIWAHWFNVSNAMKMKFQAQAIFGYWFSGRCYAFFLTAAPAIRRLPIKSESGQNNCLRHCGKTTGRTRQRWALPSKSTRSWRCELKFCKILLGLASRNRRQIAGCFAFRWNNSFWLSARINVNLKIKRRVPCNLSKYEDTRQFVHWSCAQWLCLHLNDYTE